jgi:hypothetical protein
MSTASVAPPPLAATTSPAWRVLCRALHSMRSTTKRTNAPARGQGGSTRYCCTLWLQAKRGKPCSCMRAMFDQQVLDPVHLPRFGWRAPRAPTCVRIVCEGKPRQPDHQVTRPLVWRRRVQLQDHTGVQHSIIHVLRVFWGCWGRQSGAGNQLLWWLEDFAVVEVGPENRQALVGCDGRLQSGRRGRQSGLCRVCNRRIGRWRCLGIYPCRGRPQHPGRGRPPHSHNFSRVIPPPPDRLPPAAAASGPAGNTVPCPARRRRPAGCTGP